MKRTEQEKKDFDELYYYVKKEIFEYETQALPKYMMLRMIGLQSGKFMANNNTQSKAVYTYKEILYTFKLNKEKIKQIINSDRFNGEQHKFNTIMIIVERSINDVSLRLKNSEKAKNKIEDMNLDKMANNGAEYKNKTKNKIKELEDIW